MCDGQFPLLPPWPLRWILLEVCNWSQSFLSLLPAGGCYSGKTFLTVESVGNDGLDRPARGPLPEADGL